MALATFNLNTPNIPDEADILTQVRQIRSYITNLNNQLRYDLSNIDEDNLTGGELPENAISRGFRQKVLDLQGNMSVFEQTATRILARVENAEGDISELKQTAEGIILAAASDKVYRAATEAALLTQLAAEDPPVAMSVGLLWLDTTTMLIKRCKVVSPLTWEAVQANEVHTSFIDIQDDSIDIKSTGTINIGANAKLVLSSADRLETTAGTSLSSYVSSAANGRSKVYSTTWAARPTTGVQVGDLLICSDTDPVNKLYRWNGTGWEDARDGSATLAEQTDTKFKWIVSGGTSASTMVLTNEFYEVVADNINLSANDSLKLAVASEKVWRAATEAALNTALAAANITKAAGLLWYDTTKNAVKRWTGTEWANSYVNTSQIVIDDDSIDIGTTGSLNIQSGGNLNIKNLGNTANVINMDNTGLTISSTGQLKLQSTDSIIIGGSPFSVGGTNLLTGTDKFTTGWVWAINAPSNAYITNTVEYGQPIGSLKIEANMQGGLYSHVEQTFVCEPNTTYTLSAEWLTVGAPASVYFRDHNGTNYSAAATLNGTLSTNHKATLTTRADAQHIQVVVECPAGGYAYCKHLKLEKGTMATDWSPSPQDTIDALAGIDTSINGLQTQVDGKIDTYFGTSDPSSGWTAAQKAAAVGDMWYNSTAKKLKRWNGSSWDDINDQTAIDAYANAATAKDTADGKRRVFVSQPTPPYDIGDLWAGGSTGDLKRCSTAKATGGSYAAGDWVLATKYTDDTAYNNFVANTLPGLQARVQVFYQTTKPTYTAVGDLWYDTDSNPLEVWKCTDVSTQAHTAFTDPVLTRALSAASSASNAAAAAQGTANSKINTFVGSSTPTALAAGDLWLDTGNKNIWKRATAAGTGGWVQYLTAAGYVNSTGITIDGTDLTVKATGNLNLASDGNLNVQNGSNLNVLNGGDIEINNGGEINVASGGKINITTTNDLVLGGQNITAFADGRIDAKANSINFTANESIILAASGGTNYYSKSTGYGTYTNAGTLVINGRDQAGYENGFYITGPEGSSLNYVRLSGVITENGYWTVSFDVRGIQGVAVPVTVDICDLGAKKFYTNATNTYERKSLTVNVTNFSAVYHFVDFKQFSYAHYMIRNIKVEKGTMATDWSPSPSDPASGVKTSYIDIATDHIDISSGGSLSITSPNTLKITSGTTNATALAIRNDTDYFISAGHLTQSSAPFWIKKDGSVKATSGVIGGFSLSSGKLIDTATSGSKMEIDPVNGILDVGDLRITQSSSHIDLFNQQVTGPTYMRIMNNVGSISLMVATSPTTDTTLQVAQNNFYALGGTFTMESLYSQGDVSALSFTDRTPAYIGDALSDLRGVGNDKHGNLDHKTLPKAARKQIRYTQKSKDESTDDREEEGRDIGMMVSILTKAIQQLTEIVEKQQVQINQLLGERT